LSALELLGVETDRFRDMRGHFACSRILMHGY